MKYKRVPNRAWDKFQVCFIALAVLKPKEDIRRELIITITLRDNDNIKDISMFTHFKGPYKVQEKSGSLHNRNPFQKYRSDFGA